MDFIKIYYNHKHHSAAENGILSFKTGNKFHTKIVERETSVIKISKSKRRALCFIVCLQLAMKIGTNFGGKSDFYRYVLLSVFSLVNGFEFKVLRQTRCVCLN